MWDGEELGKWQGATGGESIVLWVASVAQRFLSLTGCLCDGRGDARFVFLVHGQDSSQSKWWMSSGSSGVLKDRSDDEGTTKKKPLGV